MGPLTMFSYQQSEAKNDPGTVGNNFASPPAIPIPGSHMILIKATSLAIFTGLKYRRKVGADTLYL
jgi:hypothetical protein